MLPNLRLEALQQPCWPTLCSTRICVHSLSFQTLTLDLKQPLAAEHRIRSFINLSLWDVAHWNPWKSCINSYTAGAQNPTPSGHGEARVTESRLSTAIRLMVQGKVPRRESFTAVDRLTQAIAARLAHKRAEMRTKALLNAEAKVRFP